MIRFGDLDLVFKVTRVINLSTLYFLNQWLDYEQTGGSKKDFQIFKKCDIFLIFAQNKEYGYALKPCHSDVSNKYPQSLFYI